VEETTTVLVTGGAGYLGSVLVPKLAERYRVVVLDALWFGDAGLAVVADRIALHRGDLRDPDAVRRALADVDAVIHLAAVSNDPCSELDPDLTRSVNLDATRALMTAARAAGVRRFINASSASVYGIKPGNDVSEELALEPLTLYARYKAETEAILDELAADDFTTVSVRAATVCGLSPRLRLDLTINILTHHAIERGAIRVFGGDQLRPNIHIQDLTDFYVSLVERPHASIHRRAFNLVTRNASVMELAQMIRARVAPTLPIEVVPTEDNRSYHLSGARAARELGYTPARSLEDAIDELAAAMRAGRVPDAGHARYRNVEVMKSNPDLTRYP
jgi:nucleoside-diphosphate-sugar epimerase